MDDPVSRLRLIAKRKSETRTSQEGHRQAIRKGNEDAAQTARHLIEIVEHSDNHDEVVRMAQQLVADLLDDMKTMTPEEQENTKSWLAKFTGELMVADHARDFGVDLMDEASLHVFKILSASGR